MFGMINLPHKVHKGAKKGHNPTNPITHIAVYTLAHISIKPKIVTSTKGTWINGT